jgi:hypothetical protein
MLNALGSYGAAIIQVFEDAQAEGSRLVFVQKAQG